MMNEKEKMMSFETNVLSHVAAALGADTKAEFTHGTLFVECSVADAVKLETALLSKLKCGIVFSRVGSESAYDFV